MFCSISAELPPVVTITRNKRIITYRATDIKMRIYKKITSICIYQKKLIVCLAALRCWQFASTNFIILYVAMRRYIYWTIRINWSWIEASFYCFFHSPFPRMIANGRRFFLSIYSTGHFCRIPPHLVIRW